MEDWITYYRFEPHGELLAAIDRHLVARATQSPEHCVSVTFDFSPNVRASLGLSPAEIPSQYYSFESAVIRSPKGPQAGLIGTMTGRHRRQSWFAGSKPDLVEKLQGIARKTRLPTVIAPVTGEDLQNLLPTALETQIMRDIQLTLDLQEAGDDPEQERLIEHLMKDVKQDRRSSLVHELQTMGFTVDSLDGPSIRFTVRDRINRDAIRQRTEHIMRLCQNFDCQYEGWASPVIN
jgi:regulator of RNase E activity RraB